MDAILFRRWQSKVRITESCWQWTDVPNRSGYGKLHIGNQYLLAHRLAYEHFVEPIPSDKQIDHLCRNRLCCNPAHLEAVTPKQNTQRGNGPAGINARKTHCKRGHEFTKANTAWIDTGRGRVGRRCRQCWAARFRVVEDVA